MNSLKIKKLNITLLTIVFALAILLGIAAMGVGETSVAYANDGFVASVTFDGSTTNYDSFAGAWNAAVECESTEDNRAAVKLLGNWTATDGSLGTGKGFGSGSETGQGYILAPNNKFIALDLNGYTIDRGLSDVTTGGKVLNIYGNLILDDSSINKTGIITGGNNAQYGGGVYIYNGCTFTMNGGTISNNTTTADGGGVFVSNNATFNMNGGTISGNYTETYGGGVYANGGTFTMNGGTISDNTARSNGGGVYVKKSCTFTMSDGTISGNSGYNGGGVALPENGTFNMSGGTISNNTARSNGGGVYACRSATGELSFTMSGSAEISYNQASSGGGVTVSGTININGGKISNNTATNQGGGVYATAGTITMSGTTTISDNEATKSGGGVCAVGGEFIINAGTISNNTATTEGGGVYATCTLRINGGTISDNEATTEGGGVYASKFTMNGGTISDNNASTYGGGVYSSGTFTMSGTTTISDNTASNGGGGLYIYGTSTMNGGTISGNISTKSGGGVYIGSTGKFTMNDGTISGNYAEIYGGGVYLLGKLTMTGGTISGNNTITKGGGLYIYGTFNLSGDSVITDNMENGSKEIGATVYTGGTANNVFLYNGKIINISDNDSITTTDTFSGTFGVNSASALPFDITSGWGDSTGTIIPDKENNAIVDNGSEKKLMLLCAFVTFNGSTTVYGSFEEAWNAAVECESTEGNRAAVKLYANWTATDGSFGTGKGFGDGSVAGTGFILVPNCAFITLDLNGYTIDRGLSSNLENGSVILVKGNLILDDTFESETGKITGGNTNGQGGGVNIDVGGSFTMNGGTISGNNAQQGGGVFASDSFTMNGGTISGNNAQQGGGVRIFTGNNFNLSGDAVITGNVENGFKEGEATVYTCGTASNVYFDSGKLINISDNDGSTLTDTFTGSVGVKTENEPTSGSPITISSGWGSSTGTISSDNANYVVISNSENNEKILSVEVTVIFKANYYGGADDVRQSINYKVLSNLQSNTFVRVGYKFVGWATEANGEKVYDDKQAVSNLPITANGTVTLYAVWNVNTYSVAFNKNGGSGTDMSAQNFTYGTAQDLSANTYTKTGYTFSGWATEESGAKVYDDEQSVNNLTEIADSTVTLYAVWSANTYSVAFNKNGGSGADMSAQNFTYGTAQDLSANTYTKTGYTFSGWATEESGSKVYDDAESVNNLTATADDTVTLYAVWNANTYSVVFNKNGGTGIDIPTQAFAYGTAQNLSANTYTKTGYTFSGWATEESGAKVYDDTESVNNLTETADGTVTLYAVWTANTYSVAFNKNGGSGVDMSAQNFTYGTAQNLSANTYTKTGYTFSGWATEGSGAKVYDDEQSVHNLTATADDTVTLYAVWTANTNTAYKVEHYKKVLNENNYVLAETVNMTGTTETETEAVVKNYEGFTSVTTGENAFAQTIIAANGSTVVKIYYNRTKATITIVFGNGEANRVLNNVEYGTVVEQAIPEREGYTFDNWNLNGSVKEWFPFTIGTTNLQFEAKWTANTNTSYIVEHYQQNVGNNEYTLYDTDETLTGTTDSNTNAVANSYTGFTAKLFEQSNIAGDGSTVVKIYYDRNLYALTAIAGTGTTITSPTACNYKFGSTISISSVALEHYKNLSVSVYKTSEKTTTVTVVENEFTMPAYNVTVETSALKVSYSISFDTKGGSAVDDITEEWGTVVSAPNAPTKTGYTFDNWYISESATVEYVFSTMPTENVSLIARWTAKNYTVNYEVGTYGNAIESDIVTYGEAFEPATAISNNVSKYFGGWKKDGTAFGAVEQWNIDSSITLVAVWNNSPSYAITYLGGEETSGIAPTETNKVEGEKFNLPSNTFIKIGYTFDKWSDGSSTYQEEAEYTMGNAAVRFTAIWTENSYSVAFNNNGGLGENMPVQAFTYGTAQNLTANTYTKIGYTFSGWTTEVGGAKVYDDAESVSNLTGTDNGTVTLYAVWTAIEYTISFINGETTVLSKNDYHYGDTIVVPTTSPQKATDELYSYSFSGWSGYTSAMTVSGNANFTASYNAVAKVQIDVSSGSKQVIDRSNESSATKTVIQNATSDKPLEIKLPKASVVINTTALTSIIEQANSKDFIIEANLLDNSNLTLAQKTAVGTAKVFDISLRVGAQKITTFNGASLTITLPYTLGSGETAENIFVYHLAEDGTLTKMTGTYDAVNSSISFTTNHLSMFTVKYVAPVVNPGQSSSSQISSNISSASLSSNGDISSSSGSSNLGSNSVNSSSVGSVSSITPSEPKSGLPTGAIIAIVISVVVVGGGLVAFWFIKKKRSSKK